MNRIEHREKKWKFIPKVKVGDKVNAGGLYEFEVISCQTKENLMASDTENSKIYRPFAI